MAKGDLAKLWGQWRETDDDDPEKLVIQQKINRIEEYCVKMGYAGFTVTKWSNSNVSPDYPNGTGYIYIEDLIKEKI